MERRRPTRLSRGDFLKVGGTGLAGASGLDGLRTLEIVLAAYASGENHEPKTVERTEPGR